MADYKPLVFAAGEFQQLQSADRLQGAFSGRRQAIAQGRLDSLGFPNSITTTSGLSVTINAATAPLRANFAAGFDDLPIDFSGTFASDQVFSGLTASITHYFDLERNTSTGVVTAARIAIAPVYGRIAPTSPATGLHWFKTSEDSLTSQPGMTMYEWSGSVWIARQRVFLGEAVTSASAVTSIANYAYNRRYVSASIAYSGLTLVATNHNLGMTLAEAEATWMGYGRASASDLTAPMIQHTFVDAGINYGVRPQAGNRLSHSFQIWGGGLYHNGSASVTVGQVQFAISSAW